VTTLSRQQIEEIARGAESATRGPWQVVTEEHPWALPERQFLGEVIAAKAGTHTDRRIFTTWDDGQLKGPWPIVNGSVGIGMTEGDSRHMVWIDEADAAHIARCDPDTIRALTALALQALDAGQPVAWVTPEILAAMKRGDRAVPGWKQSADFNIPLYAGSPSVPADKGEPVRPETEAEHIARDMRDGRFPQRSERQMVPKDASK
jgi:hypothetical protein